MPLSVRILEVGSRAAQGREPAGPKWEIYGHAATDPAEAETGVFWLLR